MSHFLPLTGIDILLQQEDLLAQLSKQNVGVLTNQNALTQGYIPSAQALQRKIGSALKGILAPEHGWSGLVAEGVKIGNGQDPYLNLPVWSLYGSSFPADLSLDTIIIDLQDAGLRCYTYAATCAKVMEAFKGHILICDRPNPLGPRQCGPALDPAFRSFVGYLDVPWQHGQTLGHLLETFNGSLGLPLTIIPSPPFHQPYAYPWISPSPNLPSWEAVLLYPALVMLEGTTVSEGRGTPLPFTSLGAPGLPHHAIVEYLNNAGIPGVRARPITFTPDRSKWAGKECQGVHLLVTDPGTLQAYELGLTLLQLLQEYDETFEWIKDGSYFIDLLMGTDCVRREVEGI